MATIALSLAGQVVGGAVGGPIGATIGRALGALAGSAIDNALFAEKPAPRTGNDVRLTGSSEGAPIPRLYGWSRLAGNIVWATELEELHDEHSGSKGFGGEEEGQLVASFAVAFAEGEVARLGRIWADGAILDTSGLTLRFYRGTEAQAVDSLIEARQGADQAPAYRGLCYIVFERLPLAPFGNRIPSITAELCRPVGELEPMLRAINVIPGAGEFCYDPTPRLRIVHEGATAAENTHVSQHVADWTLSIDELTALCPNLEHVSLVIAWFGDDLRAGHCSISPRSEGTTRVVEGEPWSVAGHYRFAAPVVSMHNGGPAYGGTPADGAVRRAIADLKARGLKVTLYPLLLMDIPHGNTLPSPWGGTGQPAYPWRGRITCDPAPGVGGSPDQSAGAAAQIAAFVPGYRAMILHYANLAVDAGGVDALVVGTEMRGLTTVRGAGSSFPFVDALVELATDVRAIVGPGTKLTYAADWSEATGYQPGGNAKFFHLDPLWASPDIDAIGIDNYMPASDWRDGTDHADAALWDGPYDTAYLRANIAGGEGYDWYYGSDADRIAGNRAPINDGTHGEHFVWRFKDLVGWWSNPHHDRPGGVRAPMPTGWVPKSKPIWLTEIGCGAVDKGANQPSAFGDEKSVESTRPYFSSGAADALMQRQYLRAQLTHWNDPASNPASNVYAGRMIDAARIYPWAWDARPYPAFPAQRDAWSDYVNHPTGHWLTGRAGAAASDELLRAIAADYGVPLAEVEAAGPVVHGYVLEGVVSCRDAMAPALAAAGLTVRDSLDGLSARRTSARNPAALLGDKLAVGDGPIVSRRHPDPGEEIGRLALTYVDRTRDYLSGTVTATRLVAGATAAENAGLVLDPQGARRAAEQVLRASTAARDRLDFALPLSAAALEPGDAVTLDGQGEGPFEVTEIRDGLLRRISARAIPPVTEAAIVADVPRAATSSGPKVRSIPFVVPVHLPPLAETPTTSRLLFAASASPWPGVLSLVDPATGASVAKIARASAIGVLGDALPPGPVAIWDRVNAPTVVLISGHLASADDAAVLGGGNRVAIQTDAGDWEVIGFAEAELLAPGTYRLTRLLRGQEGTDDQMGVASAGNRVVVLDPRSSPMDVPVGWIGGTRALHCYAGAADTIGQPISVSLLPTPLLPLSPVHLKARRIGGGSDIRLSWTRRSRADTLNWDAADAPLEASPEGYRVTILSGGSPLRTIETGTTAATYSAAQQTADFGAPATGFDWRVAQLSPAFGPGKARGGTFNG